MTHAPPSDADPLTAALDAVRHVVPDQGPIGVFIHHNTLHGFQHLPFHAGVQAGAAALGARPYPERTTFQAWHRAGRIEAADLDAVLADLPESVVLGALTVRGLWRCLMVDDPGVDDDLGLAFVLDQGTPERAWVDAARSRLARGPAPAATVPPPPRRHRDALLAAGGADLDVVVHPDLVRLCSSFLDQGQSRAPLPGRDAGFLAAVGRQMAHGGSVPRLCRGAEADLARAADQPGTDVLREVLTSLGVSEADYAAYLLATALALPGWTGLFARLERRPDEHPGGPPARLADLLAVRLLLERRAAEREAARLGLPLAWSALRDAVAAAPVPAGLTTAWRLALLARAAGLSPEALAALPDAELARVNAALAEADPLDQRRRWLEAYERRFRRQTLDAVHARRVAGLRPCRGPRRAQIVCCIDEREESLRRAVEEQGPDLETFGVAGFFGVAIDFQGLDDDAPAPYCPPVLTPGHEVHEGPIAADLDQHAARLRVRDAWQRAERHTTSASHTLVGGLGAAVLLGPIAGVLAAVRVVAPRWSQEVGERLGARLAPRPRTAVSVVRDSEGTSPRGKPVGFSVDEAADRVAAVLTNIGLVRDFAPIVCFLGHGSTSLNNPHESAHDCGACGGRRGGANARVFAAMANQPEVRLGVARRGVVIPDTTWFVGGLHDTADDAVRWYDVDAIPAAHLPAFDEACRVLEVARREDAAERCRRFDDAPLDLTPDEALHHVESRARKLAQPRPEYGHCTNASAFVGRRALTRGLHLDRRAFLISYDPAVDPDLRVLERILAAVGPVGAGISLEYYFSSVDNEVFGAGTKLPHNVTALVGVMNGHQGDLRTGLPLQMVELHEPMRLLLVVEATTEALLEIAGRQDEVRELVVNRWVQLISVHPETGAMAEFTDAGFVPYLPAPVALPDVDRSPAWHRQGRDHLPPALVRAGLPEVAP
jgi:uncharacterized protein YbcC (UPF0753/DUF2309 family)